jgi:hypothetical protein
MSGPRGTLIVLAAAVLGAIITVAAKRDPGSPLGWLIVAGTLIAALAVRPRSAYLLIPVPALAYVVFGLAAGAIRNQSDPASAGLAVGAAQWVANGFLTMAAATVLAAVIALGRWFLDRRTAASPAGRRRSGSGSGSGGRRGPEERLDRVDSGRSVPSDSSGLIEQSDEVGFGGQRSQRDQRGQSGRGGRSGQGGRMDRGDRSGGRGDESDWPGRGGRVDWDRANRERADRERAERERLDRAQADRGRDDRGRDDGGRVGRGRDEGPGRPKPAFYPNPDWPGDRGGGRDPRDRRPPPGPPSFGASRDLARPGQGQGQRRALGVA